MTNLSNTEKLLFEVLISNSEEGKGLEMCKLWNLFELFTGTKYARTTIATWLSRMEKKGYVERNRNGRKAYIYPKLDKKTFVKKEMDEYCKLFFAGDYAEMANYINKELQ